MLVTFGNAASRELRDRVRERLVSAERGLRDPATAREERARPVLQLLADVPDDEVERRRQRLARALAGFDEATIATTHSFCSQMLAGLGMAADADRTAVFVEDIDDLVREVVDDLYVRTFAGRRRSAVPDPRRAAGPRPPGGGQRPAGRAVAAGRRGAGRPAPHAPRRRSAARWSAASGAVGLVDYDDWLSLLRDALTDPTPRGRWPATGSLPGTGW